MRMFVWNKTTGNHHMRITQQQQVDALVTAIRDLRSSVFDRTEQIASGKRVNRPSDDPAAAERINQFRNVLRTTERRLSSVNEGIGRLNLSDSALDTAGNTIQRAKELSIQMRNDTNSAVERRNTAQEVQQLIQGLAGVANTQLNGRFIFAGSQTQSEPFVLGSVAGSASTDNTGGGHDFHIDCDTLSVCSQMRMLFSLPLLPSLML